MLTVRTNVPLWIAGLLLAFCLTTSLASAGGGFREENGSVEVVDGYEYWLGIPHVWKHNNDVIAAGQRPYELWIHSRVRTKVTVEVPGLSFRREEFVNPNVATIIALPEELMNAESEVVRKTGIHVTSLDPVSVTFSSNWRASSATYKAVPVATLGKTYRTLNLYQDLAEDPLSKPSQFLIVATQNQTTIQMKSPVAFERGVYNVTLDKGETFLVKAAVNAAFDQNTKADLSGTLIEASAPVAVISGHTKGTFPRFEGAFFGMRTDIVRTPYMEMLFPIEQADTVYMSAPRIVTGRPGHGWPDEPGDLIRFVAISEGTILYRMRQDGSAPFQMSPPLRAGQVFDIPNQEDPGYYTGNKPFIAGQYMKGWLNHFYEINKGEDPSGHVQSGAGEYTNLVGVKNWPTSGFFRSPQGVNNYVNVTFRTADLDKLTIDGRAFSSFFGTRIKQYAGTPFSYGTKEIGAGDHYIAGAPFAAYAYGNYDDLTFVKFDNYAYANPVATSSAFPCDDVIRMAGLPQCGDVDGTAEVGPLQAECAGLLVVRMINDSSSNYSFTPDPEFAIGVKNTTFLLRVLDKTKPAKALVQAISRSGKFVSRMYEYFPEEISITPTRFDYGAMAIGDTLCTDFTLTNPSLLQPTVVKNVRLKLGEQEFFVKDPSVFPMTLAPGQSRAITVCATGLVARTVPVMDSLVAELSCFPKPLAQVLIRTAKPIVIIDDADFKQVPVNQERVKDVTITNTHTVDLFITGISWPDDMKQYFVRVENFPFTASNPLVLKPQQTYTFQVVYNPGPVAGVTHRTRATIVVNTDQIKIYSDWVGMGIEAGPEIVGFDWKERRVLDAFAGVTEYVGSVTVRNSSTTTFLDNVKLEVTGSDLGHFDVPVVEVPVRLAQGQTRTIEVKFRPTYIAGTRDAERPYLVTLTLSGNDNGITKTAVDALKGVGVQPHVSLTPRLDFGTVNTGLKPSMNSTMNSNGTMILSVRNTIRGLTITGADKDFFTIDPAFLAANPYPILVPNGQSLDIPIVFDARTSRATPFIGQLEIETDAPENPVTELLASVPETGVATASVTDLELATFKSLRVDGTVELRNTGSLPVVITGISSPVGPGDLFWTWNRTANPQFASFPVTVPAGQSISLTVRYAPTLVLYDANNRASKDIATITWSTSVGDLVSTLTGTPDEIVSLVEIEGDDHRIKPGENSDFINFSLVPERENLDRADLTSFVATVLYNKTLVEPLASDVSKIKLGAITSGWTVQSVDLSTPGTMRVRMEGPSPLRGSGPLFSFQMKGFLDKEKNSILGSSLNILDQVKQGYTTVNNRPGKIWVDLECADGIRNVRFGSNGYALYGTSPSPVVGTATIRYQIGLSARTSLTIYSATGEVVATLVDGLVKEGIYETEVSAEALNLSSGTYQVRLESGPFVAVQPIIITR